MKKWIPHIVTLLNLFFGCCASIAVLESRPVSGFFFFLASLAADFLDGAVARRLGVRSALGKELDSLADVVSFGFLPGVVFYSMLLENRHSLPYWAILPVFLITLLSALRLGKFNLDPRQTDHFIGLPTPACATFVMGLLLIGHYNSLGLGPLVHHPVFIYGFVLGLSVLLVAEIPMFSLKFKKLAWKGNKIKIIFAAIALILLVSLKEIAFSLTILLYIIFSIVSNLIKSPVRP